MFHGMSGKEGGGKDTVAWASWPSPKIFGFWNYKKFSYVSKKYSDILEGGGEDTVAWVSWPDPVLRFWNKKCSYMSKKNTDILIQ